MLNIKKQGSSLLIESSDNSKFPWKDGKMSIPMNSITYIIDESDYITFRSVANNDILFTALINEITINEQSVSKDDFILMFDSIANASSSGGGTASAGVNSINGFQGDISVKTVNGVSILGSGDIKIEGASVDLSDYYTKDEIDNKGYITSIPSEYVTETELNNKGYAKLSDIPTDYATVDDILALRWEGTQDDYDALGEYDENIIYYIIEKEEGGGDDWILG